jgi:hypothetical protein
MFNILKVIFQTASKQYHQTNWQVKELITQKMLYSPDYLMHLLKQSIDNKDKESIVIIYKYLKQFDHIIQRSDLKAYKKVFKFIRENVKVSDLL